MRKRKKPTLWERATAALAVFRFGLCEVREVKAERCIGVLTPETRHETETRLREQLIQELDKAHAITFTSEALPGSNAFATKVRHTASVKVLLIGEEAER